MAFVILSAVFHIHQGLIIMFPLPVKWARPKHNRYLADDPPLWTFLIHCPFETVKKFPPTILSAVRPAALNTCCVLKP